MIWWEVVDIGDHEEQMIRRQSFSHWGMVETVRTEVYRKKTMWWGAA